MFEITLTLDKTNKEALYVQLYKYFIKEIQNGQIKAGMKLPSKRKLACAFRDRPEYSGYGLSAVDCRRICGKSIKERLLRSRFRTDLTFK